MAIYKPNYFEIIGNRNPPPNYPSMDEDINSIKNDPKFHYGKWHLAKCKLVPNGDPSYVYNQNYEIYVGYDQNNKSFNVAAPCPPFCQGDAGA